MSNRKRKPNASSSGEKKSVSDPASPSNVSADSTESAASSDPASLLGTPIARLLSVTVLIVVIVAIGILFYRVMVGFFVPLFLAALLVVIFRPLHGWFMDRLGHRRRLAAFLTTSVIMLIVLLPSVLILSVGAAQGTRLLSGVNSQSLTLALGRARDTFGVSMQDPELYRDLNATIDELTDPSNLAATNSRIEKVNALSTRLWALHGESSEWDAGLYEELQTSIADLQEQASSLEKVFRDPSESAQPDLIDSAAPSSPLPSAEAEAVEGAADRNGTNQESTDQESTDQEPGEPVLAIQAAHPVTSEWEKWQAYQQTLVQVSDASNRLQQHVLGGPVWAELKRMANPSDDDIHAGLSRTRAYLQSQLPNLASATTEFVFHIAFGLVVLVISIFFFMLDGPTMTRTMMRLSPLDDKYEEQLLIEFDRTSRAVVLATILSALTQGVLAALGYYVAGMDSVVLLFLITTFMALIPFLGATSVWLPCVLWIGFVDQNWSIAIALGLWGALVVSTIDNVIKVFILHGRSQLHPLLALLSVLGGIQVFGPIGLLVGPMIVVFLQTLLEMLHHELMKDVDPV
ncbi:putative inner membrane protein [Roseimaritima multifibrata]|uniref:Putative inner membrane protein n=1 Tax=Roseimaritima multifibrata TaxID=1930274 RepID=A0A517MFK2_9BACT|nr:AI-2E family transporter [Roseimaritima multifibrata]QDS93669.1 putative inner membrane protein [Roseimaritima multifibrata]